MKKVLIIDTSILCVYLGVPGKETCGDDNDKWDKKRVEIRFQEEEKQGTDFILPLATIIETGNHIAQANSMRYEIAQAFADILVKVADGIIPWAVFTTELDELWSKEKLKELALEWPTLASCNISLGDATIKNVAEFYANTGFEVEIFTGDKGLKAYEPATPPLTRRSDRRKS
ncbi:hypothetical protein [Trichormus variabilis]|uniref:PIN domain-containing protein n=1 Tax=Trichormus variabilis SAG 1403-4b TaxID=447716 RepID=A0A3S1A4W8_ANAVA|nr:hypothetical protein [Trichormus variabilis]MBD2628871.1 hypothetical protein [Trichormus variabilis FACHB-164]RUS93729.1 hypothetical protein DSM107003_42300 [Trichormus variabilis SAG 1403-4b]